MINEKKLDIESEVSSALVALKKAAAIYADVMDDCRFATDKLTETDLHIMHMEHESTAHKGYAVNDYISEAVNILENIDF